MPEALTLPFFQRVLLAGLLASLACGVIGTYVVAKRIASLSGGLSHAAPGVGTPPRGRSQDDQEPAGRRAGGTSTRHAR